MPYINCVTSASLDDAQREKIKAGFADALQKHAGKPEQWLMIAFNDGVPMYFKGNRDSQAAYIEIKHIGTFTPQQKENVAKAFCKLMHDAAGVPGLGAYVVFTGRDGGDWAHNGALFG